jgi:cytochrome P450
MNRAILRDTSVYGEDVDDFRPERFMDGERLHESVPIPDAAFGFGRRGCAGRASAEASFWISIVSLLSVFNFKGKEGYTESDYGEYSNGIVA